jgi:hypothetical protein
VHSAASPGDTFDNVGDILFTGLRSHDYDHAQLSILPIKQKNAGFMPRLAQTRLVASTLNQGKRSSSAVDGWADPVK